MPMKWSAWPESAEGAGERAQALRRRGARQAGGRSGRPASRIHHLRDQDALRRVLRGHPALRARWRLVAEEKLPEVEALVERALGMKDLLERGLRCECLRLEECALVGKGAQTHSRSRAPSSYSPERM